MQFAFLLFSAVNKPENWWWSVMLHWLLVSHPVSLGGFCFCPSGSPAPHLSPVWESRNQVVRNNAFLDSNSLDWALLVLINQGLKLARKQLSERMLCYCAFPTHAKCPYLWSHWMSFFCFSLQTYPYVCQHSVCQTLNYLPLVLGMYVTYIPRTSCMSHN